MQTSRFPFRGALATGVLSCVLLAGCAGTTRSNLSAGHAALADASTREALRAESAVEGQQSQAPAAPAGAPAPVAADQDLAIALVSGEPIDIRSFLARIWLRSSDVSREVLDRLVVERLALLEAERQEIAVSQSRVDERLEAAWKVLGDSLERQGRGISIAKHLQTELGVDTEYYRRQLRRDAIAQLIAERVVRTWACGRERCVVRMVELADQQAMDAFNVGLAAGRDFDSLAKELHRYREKEPGGALITVIRNENAELSRVAFNTPVGKVAGPLKADDGKQLMLRVDKLLPAITGNWKDNGAAIEKSLEDYPVDDFEFIQWRAEMVKSYSVDLDPFFHLIGVKN